MAAAFVRLVETGESPVLESGSCPLLALLRQASSPEWELWKRAALAEPQEHSELQELSLAAAAVFPAAQLVRPAAFPEAYLGSAWPCPVDEWLLAVGDLALRSFVVQSQTPRQL